MTGTLSYHATSCPQLMQAEPGLTIERFSGTRAATTFRKLPMARPGANATAASAKSTSSALVDRRLRLRVGDRVPRHPGGDDGECGPGRVDALAHLDRRAVERAVRVR